MMLAKKDELHLIGLIYSRLIVGSRTYDVAGG